jgi:hypothetical protein
MRKLDVYGGEVRPMFEDVESEEKFYKNIKAGDQLDYRQNNCMWCRAHVVAVSPAGLELRVWTQRDGVAESCSSERVSTRCLPPDTLSSLVAFKPILYGTRDAELGIL